MVNRERIPELSETIKNCIKKSNGMSLEEIYNFVEKNVKLSSARKEITYGVPNWKHSVRRILSGFVKHDMVIRDIRHIYKWKNISTK